MKLDLDLSFVCLQYIAICSSTQVANDFRNALIRYLIPAMGGPEPSALKRCRFSSQDQRQAFDFLADYSIEDFPVSLPLSEIFEHLETSICQQERVRRSLRRFIDWARAAKFLSLPKNLLPTDLCSDINTGIYNHITLLTQNSGVVIEAFEAQEEEARVNDFLRFALVRYLVPGCGGPIPLHQPLTPEEIEAGLQYLEQVPLEYLGAADTIATRVMRVWGMSEAQETRVRRILRKMLAWARESGYLPEPPRDEPVPEFLTSDIPPIPAGEAIFPKEGETLKDCLEGWCDCLQKESDLETVKHFKTFVVKYGVPALGGSAIQGRQATQQERTQAMKCLSALPATHLEDMLEMVESYLIDQKASTSTRDKCLKHLGRWVEWARQEGYFGLIQESTIVFNTFYTNGQPRQRSKSGTHLKQKSAPPHVLCAKCFPNDYTNPRLKEELTAYQAYRESLGKASLGFKTDRYQLRQYLGWLHRYEGVSLEDLSLQRIIQISPLQINVEDYEDKPERYHLDEKITLKKAEQAATVDVRRIIQYLEDFLDTNDNSKAKRVAGFIALAKFQYAELLDTVDFPTPKHIPVLRQLLLLQAKYKRLAKPQPSTISYFETSTPWDLAIHAMEMQRRRVEQRQIYIRRPALIKGFEVRQRPDTAIANALRRFLILAFHIVCPSRPRTYYDLRIGETFVEGVLTKERFIPATQVTQADLQRQGLKEAAFYIHHQPEDSKAGKNMPNWMLQNDGWWLELPNISFGSKDLYHYIRQWLSWGREIHGPCDHPYFFRLALSNRPVRIDSGWGSYLKRTLKYWTGVSVSPTSMRKMFSTTFSDPQLREGAALLLEHSEEVHTSHYDQRISTERMAPVLKANQAYIQQTLNNQPK